MISEAASITVRRAEVADAATLGRLLFDFNSEYDTPTPSPDVLAGRLRSLLTGGQTLALLAESGGSAIGIALITLRPNVWYDGPVALLDELYVTPEHRGHGAGALLLGLMTEIVWAREVRLIEINVDEGDHDAQRFYLREGYRCADEPGGERAYYWYREFAD
ncbi:GNAT family N-acetyltransferase [Millisia brevis]|uniref:GNAT family N-acetyltransferase n=1 Tax=Millisia brevis TaxID=264148 RepID=UPI00083317C1|nr:GNAT family N-acetyltransferase [Millisia brevis]